MSWLDPRYITSQLLHAQFSAEVTQKEFAAEHLSENILGKLAAVCFSFSHHFIKNNKHRRILALGGEITQWPEI